METQPDLKDKEKIRLSIPGIGPAAVRAFIIDMPELGTIDNGQAASLVGVAPIPLAVTTPTSKRNTAHSSKPENSPKKPSSPSCES
jgi:transposase